MVLKLSMLAAALLALGAHLHCQPVPPAPLPPLHYPPSLSQLQFFNSKEGTYYYHYDTGSNGPASFRGERRDAKGTVSGYFGYVDPDGVLRVTHYVADTGGYRSSTSLRYLHQVDPNPDASNFHGHLEDN